MQAAAKSINQANLKKSEEKRKTNRNDPTKKKRHKPSILINNTKITDFFIYRPFKRLAPQNEQLNTSSKRQKSSKD